MHTGKQNHLEQAHPAKRTIWSCSPGSKTIWNRLTLQREPFDHAHRQAKPFGTGSLCKENHLIMLTGKQNHLEQAHPGQAYSIAVVSDKDFCIIAQTYFGRKQFIGHDRPSLGCIRWRKIFRTGIEVEDVALIKKKIKFSSYIRKFRRERLQSHRWVTASSNMTKYLRISSYIRKPFLIYDFSTAPLWIFFIYEENLIFFSFSVAYPSKWERRRQRSVMKRMEATQMARISCLLFPASEHLMLSVFE